MASKEDLVAQLSGLTGCTAEQATAFLSDANWDIQEAASRFLESAENDGGAGSHQDSGPFQSGGPFAGSGPMQQGQAASASSGGKKKATANNSRVKTFSEMMSGQPSDSDNSESEDDHEKLYAGGEKSGIMMQGGPKTKREPDDMVKAILEKAARAGPMPEASGPAAPKHFGGSGYRLGSEDEPATAGPSVPAVQAEPSRSNEPIERRLNFWRNGFTIDDGELRSYDAPESQEFLKAINSGRAPTTLLNVAYDQPVEVKVSRNLDQDYVPPARKPAATFSGSGRRLGGIEAEQGSSSSSATIPGAFPSQPAAATTPAAAPAPINVDESQPSTSIQVRLADGSRLVVKVNHTHTVGDVRRYINGARPDVTSRRYVLQLSYPVKELADDSATVKDAGLVNAAIVQRYV
ncbi:hypothetical protein HDU86_000457 [Geranomyces michiganensis]|nr:hypothetical protein HDU86_000457 [Geranomyces michiganensis]